MQSKQTVSTKEERIESKSGNLQMLKSVKTEPTVQQERIPQVPPLGIGTGGDDPVLLFDAELKIENFFLTSVEPH